MRVPPSRLRRDARPRRTSLRHIGAAAALVATLLLTPAAARAQHDLSALRLNYPTPGTGYVSVPDKTGLQGNAAYTLEAWVYPESWSNYPSIFGNDYRSSYWLGLNTAGQVRFYPTGGTYFEGASVVPLGRWTHVAVTYTSGSARIYVNGSLDGSSAAFTGAPGTSGGDLRLGADREGAAADYYWQGYLDEMRIWSVARSASDILATEFVDPTGDASSLPGSAGLEALWGGYLSVPGFGLADMVLGTGLTYNHGTFVNSSGPINVQSYIECPLADNTALQTNGIDTHLITRMADGFANGVTVSAWIAPANFNTFQTIAGRDFTSSFWLGITPAHALRFYPIGGSAIVESPPVLGAGSWQHVAASYFNGVTKLYVNGKLVTTSTAITGPVGENGKLVWIGADPEASLGYPFNGLVDEVTVMQGCESDETIANRMYLGWLADTLTAADGFGNMRSVAEANFELTRQTSLLGSGGRLVRSGALVYDQHEWSIVQPWNFMMTNTGGFALPEDSLGNEVSSAMHVDWDVPVSLTRVLVFAPVQNLFTATVSLTSPHGTRVRLLAPGVATGHDLNTVFKDASSQPPTTGMSPYPVPTTPSDPLATFNGERSAGNWMLDIAGNVDDKVGLWSWGLQINGSPAGVALPAPAGGALLAVRGANPVRDRGRLSFTLPSPGNVRLALYDAQGRERRTLFAGACPAGSTLLSWSALELAPGAYFARLDVDGHAAGSVRILVVR